MPEIRMVSIWRHNRQGLGYETCCTWQQLEEANKEGIDKEELEEIKTALETVGVYIFQGGTSGVSILSASWRNYVL